MSNSKQIAIVTGGTRGIGAAISESLKAAGHTVIAVYAGNTAAAEEFSTRTGIASIACNVADDAACAALIQKIEQEHGNIGILVNNAGITRDGFLHKMQPEQWHDVMRTNLDSVFYMTRHVINGMRARNFGRIINIASINGQKGQMGQTNYSAAKAGIIGFTKALAAESANKGITVNCICPGYIATEMTQAIAENVLNSIVANIPLGRMGDPSEIAAAVCFLVSKSANFMTGTVMSINGGQLMAA